MFYLTNSWKPKSVHLLIRKSHQPHYFYRLKEEKYIFSCKVSPTIYSIYKHIDPKLIRNPANLFSRILTL